MKEKARLVKAIAIFAGIIVLELVALYFLAKKAGDRKPFLNAPKSLTSEVTALKKEIAALRTKIEDKTQLEEQLRDLEEEEKLADRVLPKESTPDQLLSAIRQKTAASGVIPQRITPSVGGARPRLGARTAVASGPFEEWNFTLTVTGTYDQIATFINKMEEFESPAPDGGLPEKRFFRVNEFTISAESDGFLDELSGQRKGHSCELKMQTFRYTGGDNTLSTQTGKAGVVPAAAAGKTAPTKTPTKK